MADNINQIEIAGHTLELNQLEFPGLLARIRERIRPTSLGGDSPGALNADSEPSESATAAPERAMLASTQRDDNGARIRNAEDIRIEAQRLRERLFLEVHGQDAAVEMLSDALVRNRLINRRGAGPKAVLLFVGPPGSGKGLSARALADSLADYQFLEMDLGQIVNSNQTQLIDGVEASYHNAAPGFLTSRVMRHAKTVVLFRNIERCHPLILSRIESILSSGRITDLYGLDHEGNKKLNSDLPTDFSEAVLVFSTTAAESTYNDPPFKTLLQQRPSHAEAMLLDALAKVKPGIVSSDSAVGFQFSTALLNQWRGGRTVLFSDLSLDALTRIGQQAVADFSESLAQQIGSVIRGIDDVRLIQAVLLSLAPRVGASEAKTALPLELFGALLDHLTHKSVPPPVVAFSFGPQALAQWGAARSRLGVTGANELDILEQCRRRNLKLNLAWELSVDGSQSVLQSIKLEQVKSSDDLSGPGAIKVEVPRVGFADIAGHLIVKKRLAEVVGLLQKSHDPQVRPLLPTGMLLFGPPGTGKTMLAKALAHEVDLPFISTTGSELLDPGVTRSVFARARRYAPGVVFIDEIDALGRRDAGGANVAINQLLTEMDGFDTAMHGMVFVVAATNLIDRVDPALRRAGRLDLHLEVPPLDPPARGFFVDRIFGLHILAEVKREDVIRLTAGMTGAQLEQLSRELQLALQREQKTHITVALLLETINTLRYGQRTTRRLSDEYLAHTAIHEAGHAVVSRLLNPEQVISQISIVQRANFAGYVAYDPEAMASYRHTLKEVEEKLCVLLSGRNAQVLLETGSADEGAASDLAHATALAVAAVSKWGLVPEAGLLALDREHHAHLQQAAAPDLLRAAGKLLAQANQCSKDTLQSQWPRVLSLQKRLLAEEFILDDNW